MYGSGVRISGMILTREHLPMVLPGWWVVRRLSALFAAAAGTFRQWVAAPPTAAGTAVAAATTSWASASSRTACKGVQASREGRSGPDAAEPAGPVAARWLGGRYS